LISDFRFGAADSALGPAIQNRQSKIENILGGGGLQGFFGLMADGLQTRDVLAVNPEEMRLFDLAGVFAEAELDEQLAGFAELGVDLGRG
jgi:hypothetical protein